MIKAGTGTGKSTRLREWLQAHKHLSMCFLVTRIAYDFFLKASNREAGLEVKSYQDVRRKRRKGEGQLSIMDPHISISPESLHYVNRAYDILVLDEITAILMQFNSPHHKHNRDANFQRFELLIKRAKYIIIADAYIDERTFRILKAIRPRDHIIYVHNTFQKYVGHSCYELNLYDFRSKIAECYKLGHNMHIPVATYAFGKDIVVPLLEELGCPPHRILFLNAQEHYDRSLLENINAILLGLTQEQYIQWCRPDLSPDQLAQLRAIINENSKRAFIHTSTVCQGVDVIIKHFHTTFAYADSREMTVEEMMQMIGRVRERLLGLMFVCFCTPRYREFVLEEQIMRRGAQRDFNGTAVRLKFMDLHLIDKADGSFESQVKKTNYNELSILNTKYAGLSKNFYRDRFWDRIVQMGITPYANVKPMSDDQKAAWKDLKTFGKEKRIEEETDALWDAATVEGELLTTLEIKVQTSKATAEELVSFKKSNFMKHLKPEVAEQLTKELLQKGVQDLMKLLTCVVYRDATPASIARRESWKRSRGGDNSCMTAKMDAVITICKVLSIPHWTDRITQVSEDMLLAKLPQWVTYHAQWEPIFNLKSKPPGPSKMDPTGLKSIVTLLRTVLKAVVNINFHGEVNWVTRKRDYVLQANEDWERLLSLMKPNDLWERMEDFHEWEGKRISLGVTYRSSMGEILEQKPTINSEVKPLEGIAEMVNAVQHLDPEYETKLLGFTPKYIPGVDLVLNFGKHQGRKAGDVIRDDRNYCHWILGRESEVPCFRAFQKTIRMEWGITTEQQGEQVLDAKAAINYLVTQPKPSRLKVVRTKTDPPQAPPPVFDMKTIEPQMRKARDEYDQHHQEEHIANDADKAAFLKQVEGWLKWLKTQALWRNRLFKRNVKHLWESWCLINPKLLNNSIVIQRQWQWRMYMELPDWRMLTWLTDTTELKYRCFYETIFGHLPHQMYFDLDIKKAYTDKDGVHHQACIEPFSLNRAKQACQALIEAILKAEPRIKHTDIMVFNSHYPNGSKYSYHIVINRWKVRDNDHARAFFNKVMTFLSQEFHRCVDDTMYKGIQQFRCIGSHKYGADNWKVLDKELSRWVGTDEFSASIVQNVSGCEELPGPYFNEKKYKQRAGASEQYPAEDDLSEEEANTAFDKLGSLAQCFEIYRVKGRFVDLKRLAPTVCDVCSVRLGERNHIHENENPYLRVFDDGAVYMYCRRYHKDGTACRTRLSGTVTLFKELLDEQLLLPSGRLEDLPPPLAGVLPAGLR